MTDMRWLSLFMATASHWQRESGTGGKYSDGAVRRERVWCEARRVTFVKEGCGHAGWVWGLACRLKANYQSGYGSCS